METYDSCGRCGRPVLADAIDVAAICSGCLTASEDVEETVALLRVLERSARRGPAGLAQSSLIVDAVFQNLLHRLAPVRGLPWEPLAITQLVPRGAHLGLEAPPSSR